MWYGAVRVIVDYSVKGTCTESLLMEEVCTWKVIIILPAGKRMRRGGYSRTHIDANEKRKLKLITQSAGYRRIKG